MAIKVISQGEVPEDKIYRATCSNCKTVFEFQQKDASFSSDQRDGTSLSITCPLTRCGKTVIHYPNSTTNWQWNR